MTVRTAWSPGLLVASIIPCSVVDGPGARLTIFLQGCNLDCINCHNPSLIGANAHARWRSLDDLLTEVRRHAPFIRGVTVSGGEATLQLDGLVALFAAIKDDAELRSLSTLVDTNGTLDAAGWERLAPVMDGAMVDLKAIDDERHRRITGAGNAAVLASIRTLHALDRLVEVRLLVIEGLTDTEEELARYASFVRSVDPAVPVRIMAYRHHGVRAKGLVWPETSSETMARVADRLRALGTRQVLEPSSVDAPAPTTP